MSATHEIKLALSPDAVARLLSQKHMSVEDFRCLDADAKSQVHALFLHNLRQIIAQGQSTESQYKKTGMPWSAAAHRRRYRRVACR